MAYSRKRRVAKKRTYSRAKKATKTVVIKL